MIVFEIIFIIVLGSILHFTYELSNYNKIVGWFSAVNESTWEHIKIALFPTFLTILIDYWIYGNNANYFFAKFLMLIGIVILIPVFFYGLRAIFKKTGLAVNMGIFFVAVIGSGLMFWWGLDMPALDAEVLGVIGIIMIFVMFSLLTYCPVDNLIFIDPITNKKGPQKHKTLHKHKK